MSREAMKPASPGMKLSHVASRTFRPGLSNAHNSVGRGVPAEPPPVGRVAPRPPPPGRARSPSAPPITESFIHEDEFVSCLPTTCPFNRTSPPLSSENVSVAALIVAPSGMSNVVRSVATAFFCIASGCQIHAAPSSAAPPSFSITSRRTMRAGCSRPTISGRRNGRVAPRRDLGHTSESFSPGANVR